ncbi:cation:dicarboxylase symporter family transporter [Vulcanococcus sp. Clear-D1]|uniref:cation:dicarboxylate symporter family transporter n=1 Tax=Vulcanococcus sp. Clear-D1 TaxID=2766970 RepID=UPI0019B1C9DC|nr:cation:dicarboxylase symporter family transporter [Vulcanococcus sp. Clear-D1]MBD1193104.1 cation:dicarboxylase symporter family transporter [Vulcanococcus sp. Clear-D1]
MNEQPAQPVWTRLLALWPKQIGNQCLLMLLAGTAFGLLAPSQTGWLTPVGTVFLQASQIVVMPFLICELIVGFGRLQVGTLPLLARRGGLVLLGLWLAAGVLVVVLPLFLPQLVTSEFFHAGLFEKPASADLLKIYVPENIFGALAADNFPAVVLFSSLLGVLLQGVPERDELLKPLSVIRALFKRLNKLVVLMIPYGIFALIARNVASLDVDDLIRMQGYLSLSLIAFVLLTLSALLAVTALTPVTPAQLWRVISGPLALTASSANLLIALPMLVTNLQEILPKATRADAGLAVAMGEELAPLVSLGYSLPTLGQVASLIFIPFAAWYVDQPLEPASTVSMLLRAIPASVSGIKAVVRQELLQLGLPIDLLQLVYINGEWLYRFEKVLSLEGLVVLAVLVYASGVGAWAPRFKRLLCGLVALVGLCAGLGSANRMILNAALRDTYRNDQRLLALTTTLSGGAPVELTGQQPIETVSLEAIKQRRVLRVGIRSDGLPWAYRNRQGRLVGFDMDLMGMLARDLGVKLEVLQAPISTLELWLKQGRLDLVAGGIQSSPQRAIRFELSRGYLPVHLALVVPDEKVKLLQNGQAVQLQRPVVLAVRDPDIISSGLEQELGRYLGGPSRPVQVSLVPNSSKEDFFSPEGQRRFDGLLTSAESGAAWAVMYPRTTLITPFGRDLTSELVVLVGGADSSLRRYINGWLTREVARGGVDRLFNYWILLKESKS